LYELGREHAGKDAGKAGEEDDQFKDENANEDDAEYVKNVD